MDDSECPICYDKLILPYVSECNHTFCYMCLKIAYIHDARCPMCRADLPREVYEEAYVTEKSSDWAEDSIVWLYSGRSEGWWRYDPITNQNIESGYNCHLRNPVERSIMVKILNRDYVIDYLEMTQRPSGDSGVSRKIKRLEGDIEETIKGIAGLRLKETK